ncbi:MAG: diguanylate cyclase [Phycisphaeraceae bacterium]|nr:diguanylate cyclase [Phycisphaeraceae bacterium]
MPDSPLQLLLVGLNNTETSDVVALARQIEPEIVTRKSDDLSEAIKELNAHGFDAVVLADRVFMGTPESVRQVTTVAGSTPVFGLVDEEAGEVASDAMGAGLLDYIVRDRLDNDVERMLRVAIGSAAGTERLRLLESAVLNANDSILITKAEPLDPPGPRIVFVNRAFTEMTGYQPAEVIGRTPRMLQGENSDRETLDRVRKSLQRHEPVRVELLNYRKNGEAYWVEVNMRPIRDERGEVTHFVSVQRDITDQKSEQERLIHDALHDQLTGLANRALFEDRLQQMLDRSHREGGTAFAVGFVDLDNFKPVNDTHGHPVGDEVLCQIAERLQHRLRPGDTAARYGGDEFVLLFDEVDSPESARVVGERVHEVVQEPIGIDELDDPIELTVSMGVVHVKPTCSASRHDIVDVADKAMYEAKEAGGGKVRVRVMED